MRSSMIKRLDAVEDSLGQGLYVVVYRGIPPYYVLEHKPGNQGKVTEPFQIATPEELEAYIASLPRSASVVEVMCGNEDDDEVDRNVTSKEIYSWGL